MVISLSIVTTTKITLTGTLGKIKEKYQEVLELLVCQPLFYL